MSGYLSEFELRARVFRLCVWRAGLQSNLDVKRDNGTASPDINEASLASRPPCKWSTVPQRPVCCLAGTKKNATRQPRMISHVHASGES